jgi:hypothetical protein
MKWSITHIVYKYEGHSPPTEVMEFELRDEEEEQQEKSHKEGKTIVKRGRSKEECSSKH